MKLKYEGEKKKRILFPVDKTIEKGTEIETTDKKFINDLKALGFKEVKENKKEGDK